jgi:ATP-dependent Clp protease adapter protein ClpS
MLRTLSTQDTHLNGGLAIFGNAPRATDAAPDGVGTLPAVESKTHRLPPHKLILHNDDVNDVLFVIATILKLTPLTQEEAVERTIEAHETGHSVLLVTSKERGELYVEQFETFGLTVTCEPDV